MLTDCVTLPDTDKKTLIVEMNASSIHFRTNVFYFTINQILL